MWGEAGGRLSNTAGTSACTVGGAVGATSVATLVVTVAGAIAGAVAGAVAVREAGRPAYLLPGAVVVGGALGLPRAGGGVSDRLVLNLAVAASVTQVWSRLWEGNRLTLTR